MTRRSYWVNFCSKQQPEDFLKKIDGFEIHNSNIYKFTTLKQKKQTKEMVLLNGGHLTLLLMR
jgi:hypothetical protein